MARIEKTVFISYRRADEPWALAIFQDLTQHGYDVFVDYDGIASGNFETAILENIKARAHFLVLLTPTALERSSDPEDWMRREIEVALDSQRNIVPLMLEGFDFVTPAIATQLTGKLAALKQYNGLPIPKGYFAPAMERLRNKFLNVRVDAVLHPASDSAQQVAKEQKDKATIALGDALHQPWLSLEEPRKQEETAAQHRAEEERRRQKELQEEARQRAEEERRREEAETKRRLAETEAEKRRAQPEQESQQPGIDSKRRSRRAILQAKADWEQHGRCEDLLLPAGFQLERARALLADPGDLRIDDIQEFITLSSARQENERKQKKAEKERARFQRILLVVITSVAMTVTGLIPLSSVIFKRFVIPAREEAWNATLKSTTASGSEKAEAIRGLARNDLSLDLTNTTLDDVAVNGIEARRAKFIQAHLNNVRFERSDLSHAAFSESVIIGGKFDETSLELSRFDDAMIADTSFSNANLYRSIFDRALFCQNVQFSISDVRSASFRYATFDGDHVPQFNGTAWWLAVGWSMQQVQNIAARSSGVNYKDTPAFKDEMQYYEKRLSTTHEPTLARAMALNGTAWVLATYGIDLADAERLSQEALTIVRGLARKPDESSSVVREEASDLDTLAYIQMQTGKISEALENFKAAVQKAEEYGATARNEVIFRYALAQFATGQRDEAIRNLKLAVEGGKYNPSHEMYLLRQYITGEFLTNLESLMSKNLPVSAPPSATCPAN